MAGLTGDDEVVSEDHGTLVYQESKVFSGEVHLCNIYMHDKRAIVTFEVYGLDSQDTLQLSYPTAEFDALFRFNAELMNPNRKEGRYHWVIARLEVVVVGKDSKLQLAAKPTEEVAQVPQFETHRKIPTGRMDLKERQRLREQMDMLEIRRSENIQKKRQANKERFLQKIFLMKEEDARKQRQVQEKISREQSSRFEQKAQAELQEAEEFRLMEERKSKRTEAVEVKEQRTEEQDEEEYRQLRQRWRDKDAQDLKAYQDKKAARKQELAERAQAKQQKERAELNIQMKREAAVKARESRIAEKDEQVLRKVFDVAERRKRDEQTLQERNLECVKRVIAERLLVFESQLKRKQDRELAFVAEEEKIAKYHEGRSLQTKVKTKGRFSPAEIARKQALEREATAQFSQRVLTGEGLEQVLEGGEAEVEGEAPEAPEAPPPATPSAEAGGEAAEPKKGGRKTVVSQSTKTIAEAPAVDTAKDSEKSILDEVDLKMRADLERQERVALLQKQRDVRIEEMRLSREELENQHMKEYRGKIREKELEQATREAQQRVILTQRDQEEREAQERQRQDKVRLQRLRESNVAAVERRRLERMEAAS